MRGLSGTRGTFQLLLERSRLIPVRALGLLLCAVCLACAGTANADAGLNRLKVPGDLRLVSYYPADAGWTRMWEPWRPATDRRTCTVCGR